ncbi:hypothetical protein PGT21_029442 [Puccinia graminis f. sp. tritici]|uniref:Uncharacterized protein n=1 Tax=Puccinia graminis f. sp. tritici TaxID=56615 RepID=A0A5B0LXM0_PUCGR|nr:hypothetical protein PGT21_029442 [Puccinia graminis f. sp. tritici]
MDTKRQSRDTHHAGTNHGNTSPTGSLSSAQQKKGRKMSLRPGDLLSCNQQLLMAKRSRNALGIDPSQKEIGPALTPLIDEIDQDQGFNQAEIEKLIKATKSLASSLSDSDAKDIDQNLEETQSLNRSIVRNYHNQHQQQQHQHTQGFSMMIWGLLIFFCSSFLWIIGIPLILFDLENFGDHLHISNQLDSPSNSSSSAWVKWILVKILDDHHYKFFIPLQITFGLVFVIINWGGLKIFRHS